MKVLVFGRTGQVATELLRRAPAGVEVTALGRAEADLADPAACAGIIGQAEADAVINAAAYTAVDRAEAEETLAMAVNAVAPAVLAKACAARGLPFLHLSSDYVFDGSGDRPRRPGDPTGPLGAYGRSKLAGERGVALAGGAALVLRTSWVFSAHGANFVKTMLRLGASRDALRVVDDQVGGPTPAAAIADALLAAARAMADGAPGGIHHFAGSPDVSWAGFARAIFEEAELPCRVEPIPTADYPTPAARPLNSRLDCAAFAEAYGVARPDWHQGLREVLAELETAS